MTSADPPADGTASELEALIEEQTAVTHMFVTSDRLARATGPAEVIAIVTEVLHNLVGAHHYALWLRWDGQPLLVAPADRRWRAEPGEDRALVERALATGQPARRDGAAADEVPVALPLIHEGETVGALLVVSLVPQVGERLGRLQEDLLGLLTERLPLALGLAALRVARRRSGDTWHEVRAHLVALEEQSRS